MDCCKLVLINTGSTNANFNYQRCSDSQWFYQVGLRPNEKKNIWCFSGTYETTFETILINETICPFPPMINLINPSPTPSFTPSQTPTPTPIISFSFSVRRNNTGPCTASTVTTIYSNSSVLEPGVSVYNDAVLTSPIQSSAYICDCNNSVQYFISPTGIIFIGVPGICVGVTPTPTPTETLTPTPTPTPTESSLSP